MGRMGVFAPVLGMGGAIFAVEGMGGGAVSEVSELSEVSGRGEHSETYAFGAGDGCGLRQSSPHHQKG